MNWQVFNIIIALTATALGWGFARLAYQRSQVTGARSFMFLVLGMSIMTFFYAFELASSTAAQIVTWSKFQYIGSVSVPVFWVVFAVTFSGYERYLTRRIIYLLAIIPVITLVLAWTNEWHDTIWVNPHVNKEGPFPIFETTYGAWFWLYISYSYLMFMVGATLLWRKGLRNWQFYRWQSIALFIGTLIPALGNVFAIIDYNPIPYLETSPIGFAIGLSVLGWGLFRLRVLDITPIAYDIIMENITDGLLVVDQRDRILMLNRTAKNNFLKPGAKVIGEPLEVAFPHLINFYAPFRNRLEAHTEISRGDANLELRILPLYDFQDSLKGRIFIFRDITESKKAEAARQDEENFNLALRTTAALLNSTLDPETVMHHILEAVELVVPHDFSNILLIDEDGKTARIRYHRNYPADFIANLQLQALDTTIVGTFATMRVTHRPAIVPDSLEHEPWQNKELTQIVRCNMSAPILMDDELIGFVNLDSRTPNAFTTTQAQRLQAFANQAALAIKNARHFDQTRRQKEELDQKVAQLTLIQQSYREINETLAIEPLLALTMDTAVRLSQADAGLIALNNDNVLQVKLRYGDYLKFESDDIINTKSGVMGRVLRSLNPQMVLLVYSDPDYVPNLPTTQAQMVLPLLSQDRLIGVINLETSDPSGFSEPVFQLLQILVGRIGAAIENARLHTSLQEQLTETQGLYAQVSQLSQLKTDIIRIAAHDLGNPLGVIMGLLEFLRDDPNSLKSEYKDYLRLMTNSTKRMERILKDILTLERVDRMAKADTASIFDFREQVEAALIEHKAAMEKKAQQWALHLQAETNFNLVGDSIQLYEAITNLLTNAIKYTPEAGKITVSLSREGSEIEFTIQDSGYGIPEDMQERLFQPFYRVKTEETHQIDGTGLGLHLVKNIVERHGGTMIFSSIYQQGSTFGFRLPASPVP